MKQMAIKNCIICCCEFDAVRSQKLCSKACVMARQKKRVQEQRIVKTCIICHGEFIATVGKKVCSQKCFDVRHKQVIQDRRCKRTLKKCIVCHGKYLGRSISRYCSAHCKQQMSMQSQRIRSGTFGKVKQCVICGTAFISTERAVKLTCGKACGKALTAKRDHEKQKNKPKVTSHKHCIICGMQFVPYGTQRACSKECSAENRRRISLRWDCRFRRTLGNHQAIDDVACSVIHAASVLTQQLERIQR